MSKSVYRSICTHLAYCVPFSVFALSLSVAALCLSSGVARAQEPTFIESGNKDLKRAIRQAKAALPRFLERLGNPHSGDTGFEVKVRVESGSPSKGVYIWLRDVSREGNQLVGTAYTVPQGVPSPQNGQRVRLPLSRIDDWIIFNNGKMQGAYTVRALLNYMKPEDAASVRARLAPL